MLCSMLRYMNQKNKKKTESKNMHAFIFYSLRCRGQSKPRAWCMLCICVFLHISFFFLFSHFLFFVHIRHLIQFNAAVFCGRYTVQRCIYDYLLCARPRRVYNTTTTPITSFNFSTLEFVTFCTFKPNAQLDGF